MHWFLHMRVIRSYILRFCPQCLQWNEGECFSSGCTQNSQRKEFIWMSCSSWSCFSFAKAMIYSWRKFSMIFYSNDAMLFSKICMSDMMLFNSLLLWFAPFTWDPPWLMSRSISFLFTSEIMGFVSENLSSLLNRSRSYLVKSLYGFMQHALKARSRFAWVRGKWDQKSFIVNTFSLKRAVGWWKCLNFPPSLSSWSTDFLIRS